MLAIHYIHGITSIQTFHKLHRHQLQQMKGLRIPTVRFYKYLTFDLFCMVKTCRKDSFHA